jgi:hypothetical protein
MPKTPVVVKLAVIVALAVLQFACPRNQNQMRPIGSTVKASLVIYFNRNVTEEQVEKFWHEVLSRPDLQGRGHYYHRNGVGEIGRIPPVQEHKGISISFFPDATKEEREGVERDISSSPIVYRVLQNIAPAEVRKIE